MIGEFNEVDVIIGGLFLVSLLVGYSRGVIKGTVTLVNMAASLAIAYMFYPTGARALGYFIAAPLVLLKVMAGILIFGFFWLSLGLGFYVVLRHQGLRKTAPVKWFGLLPGLTLGTILAVCLLTLPVLVPVNQSLSVKVSQSFMGDHLVNHFLGWESPVRKVLGKEAESTMTFLSESQQNRPTAQEDRVDEAAEARLLELMNSEREKEGVDALRIDLRLVKAARNHSEEMVDLGYFDHESPVRGSVADRVRAEGLTGGLVGENLAWAPNVEVAHASLMDSPGHRRNVLDPRFTRVGVGVIDWGAYGQIYTVNFMSD